MIKPFFDNNKITIVFSVDNNFFPLLAVAIESIIIHSTINNKYDINILCEEFLSLDKQNKIIRQAENIDNINIRFINISSITDRYDNNIFYTRRSFTKAAYYRLFIPEVFNDYERAVYFDCDIILQCDAVHEAVVRADNWGWGNGYAACTHYGTQGDWANWLKGMNGAKVTVFVTNNGDGTADVLSVMEGTTGQKSTQYYYGLDHINSNKLQLLLSVDRSHIVFDN